MELQSEEFPELTTLQIPRHPPINPAGASNWKDLLPSQDPNPAPADEGVSSPTMEERERARPGLDTGQRRNPWRHDGNLKTKPPILKADLVLPNVQGTVEGDILCLEPSDYVPIVEGWGYCLLGFMAGKFPGRDAIERLILSWAWPARVAFHPNGWMVFRFETEADMEAARLEGNLSIFGISLMLCSMPEDFNFEEAPEFKFKVWASLPGLQLELWQPSTLAKIANMVGTPIEVDHRTVARVNIDGPRIHVLVDAKNPPLEFIKIKLPNGKVIEQQIKFDFYPLYCCNCRRMGHSSSVCRLASRPNPNPSARTRGVLNADLDKEGWQTVRRRNGRSNGRTPGNNLHTSRAALIGNAHAPGSGRGRSRPTHVLGQTRARSASRPPIPNAHDNGHAQSLARQPHQRAPVGNQDSNGQHQQGLNSMLAETDNPTVTARGAIPRVINNTHTYIPSPPSGANTIYQHADPMIEQGQHTIQPSPSQPSSESHTITPLNSLEDSVPSETSEDESEAEVEDTVSDSPSHVSETQMNDMIHQDLREPATIIGSQKSSFGATQGRRTRTAPTESEGISQSLISTSSSSDGRPELTKNPPGKGQGQGTKTRTNSPRKPRGGAVVKNTKRLR